MSKVEMIKEHIKLREIFWERSYNPLYYVYGFLRCMMHSKKTIEGANKGLRQMIENYGTVSKLNSQL
jgi:hypothetical protein